MSLGSRALVRPTRVVTIFIVALAVLFVVQVDGQNSGQTWLLRLYLVPEQVFQGAVWQLLTYAWIHDPSRATPLLFNLLWLWSFGPRLERRWGPRRFVTAYLIFIAGGAALTLLVGALGLLSPQLWVVSQAAYMGAGSALMGLATAFALSDGDAILDLWMLGQVRARTFAVAAIVINLVLVVTSAPLVLIPHLGGMAAAALLVGGWWRPSRWREAWQRQRRLAQRRKLEKELKVIQGGKSLPDDPKHWN